MSSWRVDRRRIRYHMRQRRDSLGSFRRFLHRIDLRDSMSVAWLLWKAHEQDQRFRATSSLARSYRRRHPRQGRWSPIGWDCQESCTYHDASSRLLCPTLYWLCPRSSLNFASPSQLISFASPIECRTHCLLWFSIWFKKICKSNKQIGFQMLVFPFSCFR